MMSTSPSVSLDLDSNADVLYLRLEGARIEHSREAPSDDSLILNMDREGQIVGVQVLYASNLAEHWHEHPDKGMLPAALCSALDNWTKQQQAQ